MSRKSQLIERLEHLGASFGARTLQLTEAAYRVEIVLVARYTLASMEAFRISHGGASKDVIAKEAAHREGVFPDHNGWPPTQGNETNYEFQVPNRSVVPGDTYHFISTKTFSAPLSCADWIKNLPEDNFFLNAATETTLSTQLVPVNAQPLG